MDTATLFQRADLAHAMKVPARHGLGAHLTHAHDENGDIVGLPGGMVQLETDLKVSFVDTNDTPLHDVDVVGQAYAGHTGMAALSPRCIARKTTAGADIGCLDQIRCRDRAWHRPGPAPMHRRKRIDLAGGYRTGVEHGT